MAFSCLMPRVTVPWYLWAVNLWPVISLVVSQTQLSILHQYGYVSQTGPTVTTDINKEWEKFDHNDPKHAAWKLKSWPPANASLGCGIWLRLPSLFIFSRSFHPLFPPVFLTQVSAEDSSYNSAIEISYQILCMPKFVVP